MTLPVPGGGSRGLAFRVLGFPVRIDLSFVIVLGFLGLSGPVTASRLVAWIVIGAVSVLAHELGHAVAARTTGAEPVIDLYGFGGVTRYRPARPLSRLRQLSISLAGPLVGVVVGLALLYGVPRNATTSGSLADYALQAAIFVNLGWGVLNLLPVLPLDGGAVLAELLPGDQLARRRRAAYVSVVVAAAVAVVAFRYHQTYGALLAGWLAVDNVRLLRGPTPSPAATPPSQSGPSEIDRSVLWLVDQGQLKEARHLADTAPPGKQPDMAVHGLVMVLTGQPGVGRQLLLRSVGEAPGNPTRIGAYARLLVHDRNWAELADLLDHPVGDFVPTTVIENAHRLATADGNSEEAARLAAALARHNAGHGGGSD